MSSPVTLAAQLTSAPAGYHTEGPLWDERIARLLWIDQYDGLVNVARVGPDASTLTLEHTHRLGSPAGALVPIDGGDGWIVACAAGFAHLSLDGELRLLEQPERGATEAIRMNDGKCDPQGRFWAGSMALDKRAGAGTLYRLDADLTVRVMREGLTISNGMAWSPDGRWMYFIDTPTQRVDRFDVDADGTLGDRRSLAVIDACDGAPDGMCVDDEGCLWVALWGGSQVRRYSPAGEVLATVSVPAPQVSSCAFGGPGRRTLYITTSAEDMDESVRARHPLSGRLFCVELEVGGPAPAPFVWGDA